MVGGDLDRNPPGGPASAPAASNGDAADENDHHNDRGALRHRLGARHEPDSANKRGGRKPPLSAWSGRLEGPLVAGRISKPGSVQRRGIAISWYTAGPTELLRDPMT